MMNTNSNNEKLVLVTGGAGFIAMHCMIQLLDQGYRVRATLRSLARAAEVLTMLREGGVEAGDRLTFVQTDLSADEGWSDAGVLPVRGRRFYYWVEEVAGKGFYRNLFCQRDRE